MYLGTVSELSLKGRLTQKSAGDVLILALERGCPEGPSTNKESQSSLQESETWSAGKIRTQIRSVVLHERRKFVVHPQTAEMPYALWVMATIAAFTDSFLCHRPQWLVMQCFQYTVFDIHSTSRRALCRCQSQGVSYVVVHLKGAGEAISHNFIEYMWGIDRLESFGSKKARMISAAILAQLNGRNLPAGSANHGFLVLLLEVLVGQHEQRDYRNYSSLLQFQLLTDCTEIMKRLLLRFDLKSTKPSLSSLDMDNLPLPALRRKHFVWNEVAVVVNSSWGWDSPYLKSDLCSGVICMMWPLDYIRLYLGVAMKVEFSKWALMICCTQPTSRSYSAIVLWLWVIFLPMEWSKMMSNIKRHSFLEFLGHMADKCCADELKRDCLILGHKRLCTEGHAYEHRHWVCMPAMLPHS